MGRKRAENEIGITKQKWERRGGEGEGISTSEWRLCMEGGDTFKSHSSEWIGIGKGKKEEVWRKKKRERERDPL